MKKQLLVFTVVGGLQYFVDIIIFSTLIILSASIETSNILSRLSGALLGYRLNAKWTFKNNAKKPANYFNLKRLTRYVILWISMTLASTIALYKFHEHTEYRINIYLILTKIIIEFILFIISFLVSRHWVFR